MVSQVGAALAMAAAVLLMTAGPAAAAKPGPDIKQVSTVAQLHRAVADADPGDDIVIARGTYRLERPLRIHTPHVTLRGATGKPDDVVLTGGGMNNPRAVSEAVMIEDDDIIVRDLTLSEFYRYGFHIRAESNADRAWICNVKTVNIGERHVKGSRGRQGLFWSDDVVIERLHMLQKDKRRPRPGHPVDANNYIGGIDAMRCRNWVIRDCLAEGIRGVTGGGNAAFFLWNGVDNVVIERNRIIRCCKGIALGNPHGPGGERYHATGGVIRNNFILRSRDSSPNNIGIELCNARDVKVFHNTIYSENPSYIRAVHLFDQRGEGLTEGVVLAYNIIRGRIADNTVKGGWRSVGNLHGWKEGSGDEWKGAAVEENWFVNVAKGDLHLTRWAVPAIDRARRLPGMWQDIDGEKRPAGKSPDIGADECRLSP